MSQYDMDISQKVEQMVLAEPTFSDLKGSVGELNCRLFKDII